MNTNPKLSKQTSTSPVNRRASPRERTVHLPTKIRHPKKNRLQMHAVDRLVGISQKVGDGVLAKNPPEWSLDLDDAEEVSIGPVLGVEVISEGSPDQAAGVRFAPALERGAREDLVISTFVKRVGDPVLGVDVRVRLADVRARLADMRGRPVDMRVRPVDVRVRIIDVRVRLVNERVRLDVGAEGRYNSDLTMSSRRTYRIYTSRPPGRI